MADTFNPFPSYAVMRLNTEARKVSQDTIQTPAIATSRARAASYAKQWRDRKSNPTQTVDAMISAVRGDYGTGKTHLLIDAAAQIQEALAGDYPDLTIVRVACLETDPLTWFRLSIWPVLNPAGATTGSGADAGRIALLMTRLYAEAGRIVAAKTKLTEGAVERLTSEPKLILALVKDNLLSMAAVDVEFSKLIEEACQTKDDDGKGPSEGPTVSEDVKRALAATVWIDTAGPALRWLGGKALQEAELGKLRLSANLTNEEDAAGVLIALAAIHRRLRTPFVLLIDELEHLTRFDQSRNANANINWLKRVLERLAEHEVFAIVSGHWRGWEVQKDFLDRFERLSAIDLLKLTAEDVLHIVKKRVPTLKSETLGLSQADAIARCSEGNMRRVLTLCLTLFRETDGFSQPLTEEQIETAAQEIGQRLSPEAAIASVRSILEQEGLRVQAQSATSAGVFFDLIGYQGDQLRVVVDFKHAVHQVHLHDRARVFLDRVEEVFKTAPAIVACFIADGNIDDKLLTLLKATRPFKLLWYDLTKPDTMTSIAADLRVALRDGDGSVPLADPRAAELTVEKNQSEELMAQLEARIKAASADTNAGLVAELQQQQDLVGKQLSQLNQELAQREATMRAEFLKSLKDQVEELDKARNAELQELYLRLETERRQAESPREKEVLAKEEIEDSPRLNATFQELTRRPSLGTKLRMGISATELLLVFACFAGGVALYFGNAAIAEVFGAGLHTYALYRVALYVLSSLLIFYSGLMVWRRVAKVERFLDYSARTLRQIYIRSESVEAMLRADNILRDSLETHGPVLWKEDAELRLWDEFREMLGRPPEHVLRHWQQRHEFERLVHPKPAP